VAARYQALLARQVLPELRAGRWVARLLYCHPRLRNWVFRGNGQALVEFMVRVIMGEGSYRGALGQPSSYLNALARRQA
jgi:hypothetical protein